MVYDQIRGHRAKQGSGAVGGRGLVLEKKSGVLEPQMGAQRVDAAVCSGAVGAERALRGVRVEVVPAVGHLLAARLAAPERRGLGRRHEHVVVRILRRRRHRQPLCNNRSCQPHSPVQPDHRDLRQIVSHPF